MTFAFVCTAEGQEFFAVSLHMLLDNRYCNEYTGEGKEVSVVPMGRIYDRNAVPPKIRKVATRT